MKPVFTLLSILLYTLSFGQSEDLAKNYFDQGEYEKAEVMYAKLHQSSQANQSWLLGYVETLNALDKIEEAQNVLKSYLVDVGEYPNIQIELGYLYQKQQDTVLANTYYKKAIAQVEKRPGFAYSVGNSFQKYGLLDLAAQTFETAQSIEPRSNNKIQLARIYGEQSRHVEMFENYMDLILENTSYFQVLNREFSQHITEDSNNEANQALRRVLLQRNQKEPQVIYNQILSWLFVQQEDYAKAFVQEKAIYQRVDTPSFDRFIDLASVAKANEDLSNARKILEFAVEKAITERELLSAERQLLLVKQIQAKPEELDEVEAAYRNLISKIGRTRDSFLVQKDLAEFLAVQKKDIDKALEEVERIFSLNLYQQQLAELKLLEADLNVQKSKFNQALLLYTQVEKMLPNTNVAREAKFKVAKTSYYTGDFDWALTQLKVLKSSASQLTANDAMELSLLIKDNSLEDSTRVDLKLVAKADLLKFQNQPQQALELLESVLEDYKSPAIIDDVLLRIAELYIEKSEFETAIPYLQRIVNEYQDQILADNANFMLGQLYMDELDQTEKAKAHFETIIFNHPDSIYVVEARKRFRKLRGDQIQ
jgi:tetratricopeptide (TPR) repeat protein